MSKRALGLAIVACSVIWAGMAVSADEPVKIALDWTPNTNHTGIVVAQQLGYFAKEGLSVKIVQPGPTMSVQLAASGQCEFAVSMQEYVTMARAQDVPVVSIAAVFPHNTSGFRRAVRARSALTGRLREPSLRRMGKRLGSSDDSHGHEAARRRLRDCRDIHLGYD